MTTPIEPLISCLCLSRKRPDHLHRAIGCFLAQTYRNKELVVVYPAADEATAACIRSYASQQIRPVPLSLPGATLGELRNVSIECARGEYACGWDDDDWHNPDRLRRQLQALLESKKSATVLARMFIYDGTQERAYLACERLWENSIFFHKRAILAANIKYPHQNKAEDYEFVNQLVKNNLVYPVYDATSYIYNITGANTCDTSHFAILLKRSTPLNDSQTAIVRRAIERSSSPEQTFTDMETTEFKGAITYVRHNPYMLRV